MPLQRKILITYLIMVLLPLTVLFTLVTRNQLKEAEANYGLLFNQANESINNRLTSVINGIETSSSMYIADRSVVDALEHDFYAHTSEYTTVLREMRQNTLSVKINPYLSSITYISTSGASFSGAGYNEGYLKHLAAFTNDMENSGVNHTITPIYDTVINKQDVQTITYIYALKNGLSFKKVGYAYLNLDLASLRPNFEVLTGNNEVCTFAFQDDKILYKGSNINAEILEELKRELPKYSDEIKEQGSLTFRLQTSGGELFCSAMYNNVLDVIILNYVPARQILNQIASSVKLYFIIVIMMMAVFFGVSFLLSLYMTKPIRVLQKGMEQVEKGYLLPITEEVGRQDDMGDLIKGFNQMVERLNVSLIREYEAKDLQRKAQINMLQSQINPHFLYNVLNVISSIAVINDVPEISELSENLGDMFRYNTNDQRTVTLEEEINQVHRYLEIQKMCMGVQVELIYDIDTEAFKGKIIKFLLQPLIENSLIHGFAEEREGIIIVKGKVAGNELMLEVEDNGQGIPKDRLEYLLEQCEKPVAIYTGSSKWKNIGMFNVNFRLKAFYGEEYGINVVSKEGSGTKITMRIPLNTEEGL